MLNTILIISVVLIVIAAIVGIIIWRVKSKHSLDFSFQTSSGIKVKLSPKAKCTIDDFELWTDFVVSFWNEKEGWDRKEMLKLISKVEIILYDEIYIERSGMKVNGITWPNKYKIEIATYPKYELSPDKNRIASLFRHEMSHLIVGYIGKIPFDNETHHKLFAKDGLGA